MDLDQRCEAIRRSFRRERIVAALLAPAPSPAPHQQSAPTIMRPADVPALELRGTMSARASEALFGY